MYRSSRTAIALMAAASALPVVITVANAGEGGFGMSGLAEREMIRRQTAVQDGDRLLNEGREAYAKGDYQMAVDKYSQALQKVPDAPMFLDRRLSYISHLSDASVALAMNHRKFGKYKEAREILEAVIAKDPENAAAKRELGYLDDPIRNNPALTFEHTQNIDEVRRTLYMAEGNVNLGKFDAAKKEYEKVLRIDRYNSAARRGLEQLAATKSAYYRAAYDHTRAELLMQVDQAWELAVPNVEPSDFLNRDTTPRESTGVSYITAKLRGIIIPKISFENTTVEEAINFLRQRSMELDTMELDPNKKGVNFVVRRPRATALAGAADPLAEAAPGGAEGGLPPVGVDPGAAKIHELRLTNVPIAVVLKYICDYTKLRYKVDDFAVTLVPQTETGDDLYTRTFSVPPGFQGSLEASAPGGAGGEAADPFADAAAPGGAQKLKARPPIKDLLKNMGVKFPEGASAALTPTGSLIVTNTPAELDIIEQVVNANIGSDKNKQVKVITKFVEITQENSDELGFDWILSPFGLAGDIFGSGGATGNGSPRKGDHFSGPLIPGEPLLGAAEVQNMMTNGNRSGDFANQRNSIDGILNNPYRTAQQANVAPGIMALTGLFSDGQVKLIMRGLAQRKGTDLMTAPSVVAKTGEKATIEIIREFMYPTEYDPPQIPNQVGNNGNNNGGIPGVGGGGGGGGAPVTPATPTAFEIRNTGVMLEIEPIIGDNDFVISLRVNPEIVEFEGFINYGSPILAPSTDALGNPVTQVVTENRIEMPVFSTRRVSTNLSIYDGYTVAIGGLMREDVQSVEDKVPILGDIPIIGRLFQTKAENRIKSNLIVFVTAQIIDATGRPLRGVDSTDSVPVVPGAPVGADAGAGAGMVLPTDLPQP